MNKRIFYPVKSWQDNLQFKHLLTSTPGPEYDINQLEIYENIEPIPEQSLSLQFTGNWSVCSDAIAVLTKVWEERERKKCDCSIHLLMQRGCICGGV